MILPSCHYIFNVESLILEKKQVGEKVVVYLEGRLDVSVAGQVEEDIMQIIDEDKVIHIVLNMQAVEYMSSSGFRACIATLRKLHSLGGSLRICNIKPSVKRIFDVIELTTLFDIYDSEQEALATDS